MKKKLIAGFVILLAAVFLVAMLVKLGGGEGNADLTQPSAEGTKPITEQGPVMENGAFTFTAAGFADRFSGTLIITGEIAEVTTAIEEIVNYFQNTLGYVVCPITKR